MRLAPDPVDPLQALSEFKSFAHLKRKSFFRICLVRLLEYLRVEMVFLGMQSEMVVIKMSYYCVQKMSTSSVSYKDATKQDRVSLAVLKSALLYIAPDILVLGGSNIQVYD